MMQGMNVPALGAIWQSSTPMRNYCLWPTWRWQTVTSVVSKLCQNVIPIKYRNTVKPAFKTTWEIRTTWELRTTTSVPRSIRYREMDLRDRATSVFDSPSGVHNSQVPLYLFAIFCFCKYLIPNSTCACPIYMTCNHGRRGWKPWVTTLQINI